MIRFRLQSYCNKPVDYSVMQIKAILDPDEARSVGLDMNGYSQIVNRVVEKM